MHTTIKDIASRAGVSSATVSHTINKTRFVSDGIRERVLKAMNELGYSPNHLARSLRQGQTKTIGLILPDCSNPYFAELGRAIEKAAFKSNYNIILCNTENKPEKELFYINILSQKQVDGMIFVSTGDDSENLDQIIKKNIVFVMIDREIFTENKNRILLVSTDHFTGGKIATEYIINLGHQRIGCLTGPHMLSSSILREEGYRQALKDAKIPVDERYIINGNFDAESGYTEVKNLMSASQPPTAILACNDLNAMGIIRGAVELGLNIPHDLSIVGFDDIDLAAFTTPPLTTISQPKEDIAESAMEMLISALNKDSISNNKITLNTSLVERDSCASPKLKNPRGDKPRGF